MKRTPDSLFVALSTCGGAHAVVNRALRRIHDANGGDLRNDHKKWENPVGRIEFDTLEFSSEGEAFH
jgi:hypothetical protein